MTAVDVHAVVSGAGPAVVLSNSLGSTHRMWDAQVAELEQRFTVVRYDTRGYAPTYVVNDYYDYDLRQPPRGYHWRRDDRGDFLLVAIATGIIAEVLLH